MSSNVHFMSQRQDWETPKFLFDGLNAEFGFELDVCATPENAKCRRFFTPQDDALSQHWEDVCWMNPPYGERSSDGYGRLLSLLKQVPRWCAWSPPGPTRGGGIGT